MSGGDKPMEIGFTGTKQGATLKPLDTLMRLIREKGPTEFHIGDCKGADEDA